MEILRCVTLVDGCVFGGCRGWTSGMRDAAKKDFLPYFFSVENGV